MTIPSRLRLSRSPLRYCTIEAPQASLSFMWQGVAHELRLTDPNRKGAYATLELERLDPSQPLDVHLHRWLSLYFGEDIGNPLPTWDLARPTLSLSAVFAKKKSLPKFAWVQFASGSIDVGQVVGGQRASLIRVPAQAAESPWTIDHEGGALVFPDQGDGPPPLIAKTMKDMPGLKVKTPRGDKLAARAINAGFYFEFRVRFVSYIVCPKGPPRQRQRAWGVCLWSVGINKNVPGFTGRPLTASAALCRKLWPPIDFHPSLAATEFTNRYFGPAITMAVTRLNPRR